MHIDTSLAHGLAKRDLRNVTRRGLQAEQSIERLRANWRNGCYTRKAAVRRAIGGVDRLLAPAAWAHRSYDSRRGGFAAWLVPGEDDAAFTVTRYQLICGPALNYPLTHKSQLLSMDLHAIARGHQRLGEFHWPDVRRELRTAVLMAPAIADVASRRGWRQFALPAADGLLVGEVTEDGALHARTFVTGLTPRWQTLRDRLQRTLDECETSLPLDQAGVDHALGANTADARRWRDTWQNVCAGEAFEFLRHPYEPMRDPEQLAWGAAP